VLNRGTTAANAHPDRLNPAIFIEVPLSAILS